MSDEVRRARRSARSLLLLAVVLTALCAFLILAKPGGFHGMVYEPPWYEVALPWVGVAGHLIGLSWMIWIYRRSHLEPEPDEPMWRYRS